MQDKLPKEGRDALELYKKLKSNSKEDGRLHFGYYCLKLIDLADRRYISRERACQWIMSGRSQITPNDHVDDIADRAGIMENPDFCTDEAWAILRGLVEQLIRDV